MIFIKCCFDFLSIYIFQSVSLREYIMNCVPYMSAVVFWWKKISLKIVAYDQINNTPK